ncbi:MAG: hypothetical protein H0T47_15100 [Planctomycetaceae bacterium]|nr:hypothetical protein [Planctomycetaceae bacterium]
MRDDRRFPHFSALCPRCGYLNRCRLVEGIHPPSHTQAEYDCRSCGQRSVTDIAAVHPGFGCLSGMWVESVPATVHNPERLRRLLASD